MGEDETSFESLLPQISTAVQEIIDVVLSGQAYNQNDVQTWVDDISAQTIDKLQTFSANFKYIVTTNIVQRVGAGIHFQSSFYWDQQTDGHATIKADTSTMHCIVHVFGIGI